MAAGHIEFATGTESWPYLAWRLAWRYGSIAIVLICLIGVVFKLGSSPVMAYGAELTINKTEDIVVHNKEGRAVAMMQVKNGVLEGRCEWYDDSGELIVFGFFKNGKPYAGTFLNWAKFFRPQRDVEEYDITYYIRDWVTLYEAAFDSEPPRYVEIIEVYVNGHKIQMPRESVQEH